MRRGVDQIYHLASAGTEGKPGKLITTAIEGTGVRAQDLRDATEECEGAHLI